jgi:hypothetical protein
MNQRTTDAPASWGYNVTAFERHFGVRLEGLADGYAARRKIDGRPRGPRLRARTLDELAVLIEAQPS